MSSAAGQPKVSRDSTPAAGRLATGWEAFVVTQATARRGAGSSRGVLRSLRAMPADPVLVFSSLACILSLRSPSVTRRSERQVARPRRASRAPVRLGVASDENSASAAGVPPRVAVAAGKAALGVKQNVAHVNAPQNVQVHVSGKAGVSNAAGAQTRRALGDVSNAGQGVRVSRQVSNKDGWTSETRSATV